jgi:G3E family GTPase
MLIFALTQIPLIPTTGLADPAPVAQTFFVDEAIKAGARLDAIVTVVDAVSLCPQRKYLLAFCVQMQEFVCIVCECVFFVFTYQGVYTDTIELSLL